MRLNHGLAWPSSKAIVTGVSCKAFAPRKQLEKMGDVAVFYMLLLELG
jgi:hypothetical protein